MADLNWIKYIEIIAQVKNIKTVLWSKMIKQGSRTGRPLGPRLTRHPGPVGPAAPAPRASGPSSNPIRCAKIMTKQQNMKTLHNPPTTAKKTQGAAPPKYADRGRTTTRTPGEPRLRTSKMHVSAVTLVNAHRYAFLRNFCDAIRDVRCQLYRLRGQRKPVYNNQKSHSRGRNRWTLFAVIMDPHIICL